MALTATKTIHFDQLMKIFKKFVSKSEVRPVLKLVNFDGEYFTATDSHVLLRVNAKYVSEIPANLNDTFLYDPKEETAKVISQSFPDTSRLIPTYTETNALINSNIKEFHNHIKAIKKIKVKGQKVVKLKMNKSYTEVSSKFNINGNEESYEAEINSLFVEGEEIIINTSSKYLNDALDTIKKLSKLDSNKVEMNMTSNMRPIHFKQEGVFDLLVTPIRVI